MNGDYDLASINLTYACIERGYKLPLHQAWVLELHLFGVLSSQPLFYESAKPQIDQTMA